MKRRGSGASIVLFLVLVWCGRAAAQQVDPRGGAPAEFGAQAPTAAASGDAGDVFLSPNGFLNSAILASRRASAGDFDALYDQASPMLKARLTRQAFADQLKKMLTGKVVRQDWASINRIIRSEVDSRADAPAGEYVSVVLAAAVDYGRFGKNLREEVISFLHEKSGTWLISGYYVNIRDVDLKK
ncbi:DUF4019 domain-containing protein [Sphingomonas pituitosa]|uniref:DUF4019 domain-containing protein n=1 Tax=Sphingomonas pituitosa TaxID=99597 RepID=UPI0012EDC726|nr:DUF4019 domain-containing protein [Sphingomonas pituitosa]